MYWHGTQYQPDYIIEIFSSFYDDGVHHMLLHSVNYGLSYANDRETKEKVKDYRIVLTTCQYSTHHVYYDIIPLFVIV